MHSAAKGRPLCNYIEYAITTHNLFKTRGFPQRSFSDWVNERPHNTPMKNKNLFLLRSQGIRIISRCETLNFSSCAKNSPALKVCDNCGQKLTRQEIFCSACEYLVKLSEESLPNYFEILKLPESYQLNLSEIPAKARTLQKVLHPDLFTLKGEEQQKLSEEYSSFVNKAQSVLSHPIERGLYLLQLRGFGSQSDEQWETQKMSDPQFLGKVMELNERLEEIDSFSDWKSFRDDNEKELAELQKETSTAFENEDYAGAQKLLARMKYFDSLQSKLKELQSQLGITE